MSLLDKDRQMALCLRDDFLVISSFADINKILLTLNSASKEAIYSFTIICKTYRLVGIFF